MGERNSEVAKRYPGAYYQGLDDHEPIKQKPGTPREFFLDLLGRAIEQPGDYSLRSLRAFTLERELLVEGDFVDSNPIDFIIETREEIAV